MLFVINPGQVMNRNQVTTSIRRLSCDCTRCRFLNPSIFGAAVAGGPLVSSDSTRLMRTKVNDVNLTRHRSRLSVRWIERGSYTYEVEGQRYLMRPGNFLLINDGQHYNSAIEEKQLTESFTLSFDPTLASDVALSLSRSREWLLDNEPVPAEPPSFFVNTYSVEGEYRKLLDRFVRVGRGDLRDVSLADSFYKLMEQLLLDQQGVRRSMSQLSAARRTTREELYRRVSRARDFIHAHQGQSLSVEAIAYEARLSPYHFLRTFKQVFGLSPHQYLLNLRLNRARALMSAGGKRPPLSLIALHCGFEDLSSFSKAFKRRFGQSPGRFRG